MERILYLAIADGRGHLIRAQLLNRLLRPKSIEVDLVTTSGAGQAILHRFDVPARVLRESFGRFQTRVETVTVEPPVSGPVVPNVLDMQLTPEQSARATPQLRLVLSPAEVRRRTAPRASRHVQHGLGVVHVLRRTHVDRGAARLQLPGRGEHR